MGLPRRMGSTGWLMHAAARQRHYNRGSKANGEATKAAKAGVSLAGFFGFTTLVIAGVLIAFTASQLGAFHMFVMLVLTSPLWGGAAILLAVFNE